MGIIKGMNDEQQWVWTPCTSLGPFIIGDSIDKYIKEYGLKKGAADESGFLEYDLSEPELSINTEDGIIDSVDCYEFCFFKGKNIVGMDFKEFEGMIDAKPFDIDDIDVSETEKQKVYSYDGLVGMMVWVNPDGKITNVICGDYDWGFYSCREKCNRHRRSGKEVAQRVTRRILITSVQLCATSVSLCATTNYATLNP